MNAYNGITGMQEARNDEWSAKKIVDVDPRLISGNSVDFTIYILGGLVLLRKMTIFVNV